MLGYVILSTLGAIIFLVSTIYDYYLEKNESLPYGLSEKPSDPSEIPVGSSSSETKYWEYIEPVLLGYLIAIVLQLPLLLSILGVI